MPGIELFGVIGFALAAYSVIANDAIQTLGTFLRSNQHRHWAILWAFAGALLIAVLAYGYFGYNTDVAFDRLNNIPYPEGGIKWYHVIPPAVLILLTRASVPVSTTFLVLTMFLVISTIGGVKFCVHSPTNPWYFPSYLVSNSLIGN